MILAKFLTGDNTRATSHQLTIAEQPCYGGMQT